MAAEVWGHGYAFEAATAAHRWLAANHPASQTVCMIQPDNDRSLKLAERLGYQPFGEAVYQHCPVITLRRPLR